MTIRYLVQFLAVVLASHGCLSKETSCIARETSNGTIYIVQGITGSNCDFSWNNISNHVLANVGGKIEKIISSNETHLHTQGCYDTVEYSWDCLSEMPTTATCHVNCTRNSGHPAVTEKRPVWLKVIIAASVLLIFVILIVCIVLNRLKQQRYTGGKPSNLNQVEMTLRSQ